jgi:lipopolysaccharide/colanic/teichoic acid biosynthesis glycosyltransferase
MAQSKSDDDTLYTLGKRLFDIVGSVLLLTIFSPVMLVTALLIKFYSPGPIFVEKHNAHMQRLGKKRRIFRLFKFRSMMVNADILEKTDPRYRKVYEEKRKFGNYKPVVDPRITPIGRFIRKYSVDEMPQLINVLRGDMSIVGPRPYLEDELEEQQAKYPGTEKFVNEMHTVKPGITGFWQVSGRSDVTFDKRIEMDAYYARKRSLWLDILVLLKTPWAMISGRGAR